MTASCTGLLDEARVTIDLTQVLATRTALPVLLLCAAAAVITVVLLARVWSALALVVTAPLAAGAVGALFGFALVPRTLPIDLRCEHDAFFDARVLSMLSVSAVFIGLSLVVLAGVAVAREGWRHLHWLGALGTLVSAAVASIQTVTPTTAFVSALSAAQPVPNTAATPTVELHAGHGVRRAVHAQAAGWRQTELFFFERRVGLTPEATAAWGLDALAIPPLDAGTESVLIPLSRGPVTVELSLPVKVYEDRGPAFLPLAVGNQWFFESVEGRGGAVQRRWDALRGGADAGVTSLTLEVVAERERDGFHAFELAVVSASQREVTTVVRANGALYALASDAGVLNSVLASEDQRGCSMALLSEGGCSCRQAQLIGCSTRSGATNESIQRGLTALFTLGLSEILGMGDLGAGDEYGVVLQRSVVDGRPGP